MTMKSETQKRLRRSSQEGVDLKTIQDQQQNQHGRKASLSDVEEAFLKALLIDTPPHTAENSISKPAAFATHPFNIQKQPDTTTISQSAADPKDRVLNDQMLFTVPECLMKTKPNEDDLKRPAVSKKPKYYRMHVGLWQAHEDGVAPKVLSRMASVASSLQDEGKEDAKTDGTGAEEDGDDRSLGNAELEKGDSVHELQGSVVSWDDSDESELNHFDAWQVLKDEYAKDFGFDYKPTGNFEEDHNTFSIIGTSADEVQAHPHVASPPLLDSIMNFLPEHLRSQNYWMKYSLIRDGASLDTFKSYARGSKDSIIAIETTRGDVFGVYTSSPWRTNPTLFGSVPSFVWKMRYNRNTLCHSLFEQASLESEIDVYSLLDCTARVQLCTHDRIGVGVGNMNHYNSTGELVESEQDEEKKRGKNYGFAICLEDDLLSGTTSRSSSYKNPCFVDPTSNGEPFEVINLELWTLTPAFSLESAEKLEMTQYFVSESIRESIRSSTRSSTRSMGSKGSPETFSSRDLDQRSFYRRIGHDDSHEELRDQWQYRRMMDGSGGGSRGIGASPRFSA
mmetsp:Transcript_13141/g.22957  ORF Transcript_13141/g.22957 Transcript_13141/m.22957 type:complete len:564 (-) Transcript_13141:111-1802(-)